MLNRIASGSAVDYWSVFDSSGPSGSRFAITGGAGACRQFPERAVIPGRSGDGGGAAARPSGVKGKLAEACSPAGANVAEAPSAVERDDPARVGQGDSARGASRSG